MGMFSTAQFSEFDKPLVEANEVLRLEAMETSLDDALLLVEDVMDYVEGRFAPADALPFVKKYAEFYAGTIHDSQFAENISPRFALRYRHLFS